MNQNLKNFLKDMANDPSCMTCVGYLIGLGVASAIWNHGWNRMVKSSKKECESQYELGEAIGELKGYTEAIKDTAEYRAKIQKENAELKEEIRKLKEEQ